MVILKRYTSVFDSLNIITQIEDVRNLEFKVEFNLKNYGKGRLTWT